MTHAPKTTPGAATPVPEGHMRDAKGLLWPIELIKPIDRARDDLVIELATAAKEMSAALRKFKGRVFGDIHAFVNMSAEEYEVVLGGKKGNLTLYSFDGRYKILLAVADNIVFDERLQAAKALIDECVADWSQGTRPEIVALVQQAFDTDKEGNINTGRILGLRRVKIDDERWVRAMTAVGESVQVVGSKQYTRFYERVGDTDQYAPINLDLAAV